MYAVRLKPAVFAVLLLVANTHQGAAQRDTSTPRRWQIEYQRNGKWSKVATFDSREEAQTNLANERGAKRGRSANAPARVVPTDWSKYENLGRLSAKYESGTRGPATISTGKGDAGGVSYGTYQLASKVGTAQKFVDQYYADWFNNAEPGSGEFSALWKQLADEREAELHVFEHLFIIDTHYQPFANRLRKELGLDLDEHSAALRDVAWSVAVQHGAGNRIFARALEPAIKDHRLDKLTEREIIELVYAERSRVNDDGTSVYFSRSSPPVQKAVLNRFRNELQDALKQLATEKL